MPQDNVFEKDGQGVAAKTVQTWNHGGKSDVAGSAVQLTTSDVPCLNGVVIKASNGNTVGTYVYVGKTGVTTATGFQLAPGEAISIEAKNVNEIYVIGSTVGPHTVSWVSS